VSAPPTAKTVAATWALELNCYCPGCGKYVDLLEVDCFWCDRTLQPCEHGTPKSRNVEVMCPKCDHEFTVDLEY
jgi:5-methylcytosine-specific restriction endonuclease McrA